MINYLFCVSNFCPFLPHSHWNHPLLRLSDPWRRWPNCYPGVPRLVPWCPNYGLILVDLWVIDLVDLLLTQPQKQLQAVARHSPKAVMSCWICYCSYNLIPTISNILEPQNHQEPLRPARPARPEAWIGHPWAPCLRLGRWSGAWSFARWISPISSGGWRFWRIWASRCTRENSWDTWLGV